MISVMVFAMVMAVVPPVPPVRGTVATSFRPPACERCAGHRGVTVATKPGSEVRAVRRGLITFAGTVALLTYIVQEIEPGVRVTYGWLADTAVNEGDIVEAGAVIGHTAAQTYIGVRVGETYVDPLRRLGFARPRLVGPQRAIEGRRPPFR
jgi:septal ring factor EnvC (AmiA/AmiB activator)